MCSHHIHRAINCRFEMIVLLYILVCMELELVMITIFGYRSSIKTVVLMSETRVTSRCPALYLKEDRRRWSEHGHEGGWVRPSWTLTLVDVMSLCAVWASVAGECVFRGSALSGPNRHLLAFLVHDHGVLASREIVQRRQFFFSASFLCQKETPPAFACSFAGVNWAETRSLAVSWPRRNSNVGSWRLPSQFSRNSRKVPPSLPQGEKLKPLHQVHLLKPCHSTFEPGISWLVACRSRFWRAAKLTPHRPVHFVLID